jgi:hypothetical protein
LPKQTNLEETIQSHNESKHTVIVQEAQNRERINSHTSNHEEHNKSNRSLELHQIEKKLHLPPKVSEANKINTKRNPPSLMSRVPMTIHQPINVPTDTNNNRNSTQPEKQIQNSFFDDENDSSNTNDLFSSNPTISTGHIQTRDLHKIQVPKTKEHEKVTLGNERKQSEDKNIVERKNSDSNKYFKPEQASVSTIQKQSPSHSPKNNFFDDEGEIHHDFLNKSHVQTTNIKNSPQFLYKIP